MELVVIILMLIAGGLPLLLLCGLVLIMFNINNNILLIRIHLVKLTERLSENAE